MKSENKSADVINTENRRHNTIAAMPTLLLCGATFVMLILDVLIPGMKEEQYYVYPILIKLTGLAGLICASICLMEDLTKSRLRMNIETALFLAFGVLMAISTLFNGISKESVFGVAYRYVGVFDIYLCMAVYMYCSGRIDSDRWKDILFAIIMTIADLIAVAFIYDNQIGVIAAFRNKREPGAIFFHGNHYGYFLSVVIIIAAGCFIIHKNKKMIITGIISFLINLIALFENRTLGSFFAAGFVLIVMIVWSLVKSHGRNFRNWILCAVFLSGLAISVIISAKFRHDLTSIIGEAVVILSGTNDIYAGNGRWGIWQIIIDYIQDRPLLGYGCEGLRETLYDYALTGSPHNEPLTYAAFFGIPAALIYIAAVICSVVKGIGNHSNNCVNPIAAFAALSYFMSSLFGLAMFYTVPFLFVMLGIGKSTVDEHVL